MDPKDEQIADAIIARQIDLFRFTAGERAEVLKILKRLEEELVELLFFSGKKLSTASRADKAELLRQAQTLIEESYGGARTMLEADLGGVAGLEARAVAGDLAAGFASAIKPALPPQGFFKSLISEALISGAPSAKWWQRQAGDTAFRFANEVRQGVAGAETNDQIVRRIRGTRSQPGLMATARHNVAALVQTSVQTVANASRMATFEANEDLLKGYKQLSTLDGHTTLECVAYAGKEWDLKKRPVDHSLPFVSPKGAATGTPRHWNCRSLISVLTKTYRELGLDIPEFKPSSRSASGGPVAAGTTFEQFIERKGPAFASDLLGAGRAELYLEKKITLSQLLDQSGRPLSLADLQKKYG